MRAALPFCLVAILFLSAPLAPDSAAAAQQPPAAGTAPESAKPPNPPSDKAAAPDSAEGAPASQPGQAGALGSEESVARFEQLLQRRPLHAAAFTDLVIHYAEQGKLQDLVHEYEQRVAALPNDATVQIVLARLYLRAAQAEKAAELVERIGVLPEGMARDESKWLGFKAEVYQRTGRLEEAQKVLAQALEQTKTISERLRLSEALADLHLRANDKEQAAAALIRLADEYPDNYLHRKHIADALAQRDLHAQAVEQYHEILPLVEKQSEERCEVLRQLGASLERLERRQEAIDAYTQALNLLSGGHWLQGELHERIVGLYRASGRLDELVQYCRTRVERAPEQTALRGLLADVLAATGDVNGAKETLAEAVQLFPKDRALSERRVQFLERVGDAEGVAAEYERIIAQQPDEVEFYIAYGQFLANNKQLEAARKQWKHVLNSALTDAALARRLGSLFEPHELFDDAVECYERSITLAPTRPESYAALSRLWFFRGEKDKALAVLKRMAEANPDDADTQAALCQAALSLGLVEEGLAAITRACELAPDQVDHQMTRADLLVQLGRAEESFKVRRAAIDLIKNAPQQAQAINILVSMYASANRLAELTKAEEDHLTTAATDPVSLLLLARAADFERDFPTARRWLMTLLTADPTHEEAGRQLARLSEAMGDIDTTVDTYRKLIDLHPTRSRQYYQAIADVRLRYDDKAGVLDTFEKMVQSSPGNATVLKEVAEQLFRLGEQEKALGYYEQSLRVQPDRHEVRLQYAKALQEAGRLEEALAAFKLAALQRTDRDTAAEALGKLHETAGQLGQLDDLIDELQARVESDPENTLVAQTLATLLIREFEYSRAMELLDLMLRHHPRDVEIQLVRAELLRRLARFDDALEGYRLALRSSDVDRDFVLGEMGKAYFEAGRVDQARATWRQINHKLYAGTLLRNNGLVAEAIETLQEGIRLKPDDYGLHRNLIRALHTAGRTDDALDAARRLLDLESDNVLNIRELAKAYVERGNRAAAAEVAGRLFSAAVAEKNPAPAANPQWGSQGMPLWAVSMRAAWGYGQAPARNNLDGAVQFFEENGLLAELEDVLNAQLASQPDNAVLRQTAAPLFAEQFGKPEVALRLLKELETATFPLEYQTWLGQCSQRDYVRVRQYQLIGSKPALRDQRLGELESKPDAELTRDEILELAVIRQSQGATDRAIELLRRAVQADPRDIVALSALADLLVRGERFADAEPFTRDLAALLAEQREQMQAEMIERVRRDFVRSLPLQFQLRVTDDLLRDVALKWTLGQSMVTDFTGGVQTMGYFRARLTLATICAKTDRMAEAREIWAELAPRNPADADGWTMLAGVAQLHDQNDVAFEYYQHALGAARLLAADALLQRIYSGSLSESWFGSGEAIDSGFNKIVEAFAAQHKLAELYDFLRETGQVVKARRVAEQYKLFDDLKATYRKRFDEAQAEFRRTRDDPLNRSVPYFLQVCKLADLYDHTGDWPAAQQVYVDYLADFPDELGLLVTLSEVAEAQTDYADAIEWEKKVLETKERLARQARAWVLREIYMVPSIPQVLEGDRSDSEAWAQRWGKYSWWGYYSGPRPLDIWPTWLRIAQLHLATDNVIAAGNALERAIGAAGMDREQVVRQILALIRQRQLVPRMLTVLRSLAVHEPTDEPVQLAFAEALAVNDRREAAAEVYRRMLRRGVSDVGVLAQVRQQLDELAPGGSEGAPATLASLEADVAADAGNANNRLRLAKAYYYSLQIDRALEQLLALERTAPHLEGLHDLLIEIYTIRGDGDKLVEALRTKVKRVSDENARRAAQRRLADELLAQGQTDEALDVLKETADPKNPATYERVGMLLHYFGRHDDAIKQFELSDRSQRRGGGYFGGGSQQGVALARSLAIKGELAIAADKIVESADTQARQSNQYGGVYAAYAMFEEQENYFTPFQSLLMLYPDLVAEVERRIVQRQEAGKVDPLNTKLRMQLYRCVGRADQAEAILDEIADKGLTDQSIVTHLIDRAIQRKEYAKAVEMAESFISQQAKPALPPGIPPQYAGMMSLMSARNAMLCKLGDVYWKMNEPKKAFAAYHQIVDEQVDETRLAYAAICMMRERVGEARQLVDEALEKQQVKSPNLLQFRALLAALDDRPDETFDYLARSMEGGVDQAMNAFTGDSAAGPNLLASFARQTGQVDRFVEFMRERIRKHPSKWEEYALLASTLHDEGRIQQALDVIAEAGKVKSLKREALQQRIGWLEDHVPPDELIAAYRELLELSEKRVKPSASLVGRFLGRGGSDEDEPVDTQSLRDRLGNLLWAQGQHDEAVTIWTERMNLKTAQAHLNVAQRYLEREAFDEAGQSFNRALELDPEEATAHRGLAVLAFHAHDAQAALTHLREVFLANFQPFVADRQQQNYAYYYGYDPSAQREWQPSTESELRRVAMQLVLDPAVGARCRDGQTPEDADSRLMLATLTGDWPALETELRRRLDAAPYEPLVWTLWATALERKGDWAEALKAWDYLRRLKQTTIAQHREQLKLVLAGKQIKDAAGGIKDATPPTPAGAPANRYAASYNYSSYRSYDYYGSRTDDTTRHLAALCLKLGQFAEAERLYLLGDDQAARNVLPTLASLTWRQGLKDRALELSRLSVLLAPDTNFLTQYAGLLAEAGQGRVAADLLVRAYRACQSSNDRGGFYAFYYGYGGASGQEFEESEEQRYGETLHDILQRGGSFDAVLADLSAQAREHPADSRLAKLILSLQIRGQRWSDARQSLEAWRQARPHDVGLLLEQFNVDLRLEDWDAALEVLDEIRKEAPEQADHWRVHEAFVRLMQGDAAAALAVIDPLIDPTRAASAGVSPNVTCTLLAAAHDHERLMRYLEALREQDELGESGSTLLIALYQTERKWEPAARLALDRVWRQPAVLAPDSSAYRALLAVAQGAQAAGQPLHFDSTKPEDLALLKLATEGISAGKAALRALVAEQPDNLNARRGLILAATLDGDLPLAAQTNQQLIDWLATRRRDLWQPPARSPLARRAEKFLAQQKSSGVNAQSVLGISMSFTSLLQQALQTSEGSEAGDTATCEPLWKAHELLQRDLLLRCNQVDQLTTLLKAQAVHAEAADARNDQGESNPYRRYGGGSYRRYGNYYYPRREEGEFARDWRKTLRDGLERHRLFGPLVEDLEQLGSRAPADEWLTLSEAYAVLGRKAESDEWRRRAADTQLTDLVATDVPHLKGDDVRYAWAWQWYGRGYGNEVQSLRSELSAGLNRPEGAAGESGSWIESSANQLWEVALLNPEVEGRLAELAGVVGPGWDESKLVNQLIPYYRAKQQPAEIVALLERATGSDELLDSRHLSDYMWACYETRDEARIEKLLAAALPRSTTLENDVALARLVLLRDRGRDDDADQLEQSLVARCRVEPVNPYLVSERLAAAFGRAAQDPSARWRQSYPYRYDRYGRPSYGEDSWYFTTDLSTRAQLAQTLGLRFQNELTPYDLTLSRIRQAYANHQLHRHAARIADPELAQWAPTAAPRQRAGLLQLKALSLGWAGDAEAARQAGAEVEAFWLAQAAESPGDPLIQQQLVRLYASRAFGPDYAKAYEALRVAKRLDPSYDASGYDEAEYLYKLGRYAEAWEKYAAALAGGDSRDGAGTLYQAGIAAGNAGQTEQAAALLRQAVWRDPLHKLAQEAKAWLP